MILFPTEKYKLNAKDDLQLIQMKISPRFGTVFAIIIINGFRYLVTRKVLTLHIEPTTKSFFQSEGTKSMLGEEFWFGASGYLSIPIFWILFNSELRFFFLISERLKVLFYAPYILP